MATLGYRISGNVETTIEPPIQEAGTWAADFKPTPERPLLDLSQGAPSSPPPPELLEALGVAAKDPIYAKYSSPKGEPELVRASIQEMRTAYGEDVDVNEEDIAITAGCNMAYFAVIKALADAGDEVILPVPWYFNHQMTNNLLGLKTVPLPTYADDGFMPSPNQAATLITVRTKAIVLVTPNNPTGAVYSPQLLASFAALARDRRIALILDETYRDFILPGPPHELFTTASPGSKSTVPPRPFLPPTSTGATPELTPPNWSWRPTLIHLFSFSKAYHIPGHRLGLVVAAPAFIKACAKVLDCAEICAPHAAQAALGTPGLLASLRPFVRADAHALAARQAFFARALPKQWIVGAQGGYYAFVRHPFARRDAREVCAELARRAGVVALPVQFFCEPAAMRGMYPGWERWIRFSVANVDEGRLEAVCGRLKECMKQWGWEMDV